MADHVIELKETEARDAALWNSYNSDSDPNYEPKESKEPVDVAAIEKDAIFHQMAQAVLTFVDKPLALREDEALGVLADALQECFDTEADAESLGSEDSFSDEEEEEDSEENDQEEPTDGSQ